MDNSVKDILDRSSDFVCEIDTDGRIVWLNKAANELFGKNCKDIKRGQFVDAIEENKRAEVVEILGSVKRSKGYSHSLEFIVFSTFDNIILHNPIFTWDENTKTVYCLGRIMDNTSSRLGVSEEKYKLFFDQSPLPKWVFRSKDLRILDVNNAAVLQYGYSKEEFLNLTIKDLKHPEDIPDLIRKKKKLERVDGVFHVGIVPHRRKDGSTVSMDLFGQKIDFNGQECMLVSSQDVTRQVVVKRLEELERDVMGQAISPEYNLSDILNNYILGLEKIFPYMQGSILKVEDNKVWNLASPSLPGEYVGAIEGLEIGAGRGSCGTAAYWGKRVIVSDIATDPLWQGYKEIALPVGLKACWSQPVFNNEKQVIATFANYYGEIKEPSEEELKIFDRSASLVSLLLENDKNLSALKLGNELYTYVNLATNDAIYDWDIIKDDLKWGQSFERIFGHKLDGARFPISKWEQLVHPDDRMEGMRSLNQFINDPSKNRWTCEYRFQKPDGTYAMVSEKGYAIRDKDGNAFRMIGVLSDIKEVKLESIKKEVVNELYDIFNQSTSLQAALENILELFASHVNCSFKQLWLVNNEKNTIGLIAEHKVVNKTSVFNKFVDGKKSFEIGKGLLGEVWEAKKMIVWDRQINPVRFQNGILPESDQEYAYGVPILQKGKVVGVLFCVSIYKHQVLSYADTIWKDILSTLGAEIKRKQLEEEVSHIFHSAPDIIAMLDYNGRILRINQAGTRLLKYQEDEFKNLSYKTFVHDQDVDIVRSTLKLLVEQETTSQFELRCYDKAGKAFWLDCTCTSSKEQGLIYAVAKDVSEKHELKELLDSATRLARIGSWEVDMKTKSVYWSPMTREIFEVGADYEPKLEVSFDFYKEEVRNEIVKLIEECVNSGKAFNFEFPIITAKGNERWVKSIGNAEFSDGQCTRLYGSIQDVHDKKNTEMRLKAVSDNIPGAIFQYHLSPDGKDKFLFMSKGSKGIWGLAPEECLKDINIVWKQIIDAGDVEVVQKSIEESAGNLSTWYCQWRNKLPNGSIRWHEGVGRPHKFVDGTIVWDSVITDITEKKEMEELLDRATDLARIGSWEMETTDGKENAIYWSEMTRQILEVGPDENPSFENGMEFYSDESRLRVTQAVDELIKTGNKFDLELLLTTAKGNPKWVRCIGESERIDGRCIRIYGSFQDIHQLKVVELELKKVLTEIHEIMDRIGDSFFALDNDWKVTYFNRTAEVMSGLSKEHVIGEKFWDAFPGAIETLGYQKYKEAIETGMMVQFEDYYPPMNRWFDVTAYPSETGLSIYAKDITIKKSAEEDIRMSNERFEKAAEATNDAIWDWDVVNGTVHWGKGFYTLFGYDEAKTSPTLESWTDHLHPDDKDRVVESIMGSHQDSSTDHWQCEYQYKKNDGSYAYVVDRGTIIRNTKGDPIRMVGAMTDITARIEYEKSLEDLNKKLARHAKDLEATNKELEQFAYVASHDLQEPLRMITNFLNLLDQKYDNQLDEEAHEYINYAVDGAKRMRQIILDLLEYSRVGRVSEDAVDIDLNELIEEVCLLHGNVIFEKSAEIIKEDLGVIKGRKTPLMQVFQNLIGNALKYVPEGVSPRIEISIKEFKKHHLFAVKDNGIGIEKNFFNKIFVIFQRLHSKKEYSGTGLGLAIVKKTIDYLQGEIWVESQVGKGSCFYFKIPKILK